MSAQETVADPLETLANLEATVNDTFAKYREALAAFMIEHGFATGHGDTFADLLKEFSWQIEELREKARAAPTTGEVT